MLKEFITEIGKKEQIENILGLGSSNTENYNYKIFFLTYKKMTRHINTTSIILQTQKGASNMQRID